MRPAARGSLAAVVLWFLAVFAFQFWGEGGFRRVSPDGLHYLAAARGEPVPAPFGSRLLQPQLARLAAPLLGGLFPAFAALTALELALALAILQRVVPGELGAAGATPVLLGFATGLGVIFGHTPVLVDPLLLLLACAELAALRRGRLVLGLVVALLAALTKEYGVLLGAVWGVSVWRQGRSLRVAAGGAAVVVAVLLAVRAVFGSGEHGSLITFLGATAAYEWASCRESWDICAKTRYYWSWIFLWPVLAVAVIEAVRASRTGRKLEPEQWRLLPLLAGLPLLLLGDWDRALLVVVPFALAVAAKTPLLGERWLGTLVAAGAAGAALAQPLYTERPAPEALRLAFLVASLVATAALVVAAFRVRRVVASAGG